MIPFVSYNTSLKALQKIDPEIQSDLLGMPQEMRPTSFEELLNIIINEIVGRVTPFIFVLDDFHVIQSESVLKILAYLLEHLPPQMHLALLTRIDPPLPLARLRARNQAHRYPRRPITLYA